MVEPAYNEQVRDSILRGADKKRTSVVGVTDVSEFDSMKVGERVARESVVLELHIRQPGFRKKMKSHEFVQSEFGQEAGQAADPDFLHVYQDILDKSETKELQQHRGKMIDYIKAWEIPARMLANGMYLMPLSRVQEIDQRITDYVGEREILLNNFRDSYDEAIARAKVSRGKHFNSDDYPDFEALKAQYKVEAKWLSFNIPAALEKINSELYERESAKSRIQWAKASEEARDALRAGFIKLTSHFTERLGKDPETGKGKTFHESSVDNIKSFISTLSDRNLTGDSELESLANECNDLMDGIDVKQIRTDDSFRETLAKKFEEFMKKTESLIVTKEREFAFEE